MVENCAASNNALPSVPPVFFPAKGSGSCSVTQRLLNRRRRGNGCRNCLGRCRGRTLASQTASLAAVRDGWGWADFPDVLGGNHSACIALLTKRGLQTLPNGISVNFNFPKVISADNVLKQMRHFRKRAPLDRKSV